MEARNRSLPDWMTRIRTRQLVLPRFQRMEAWGYREVTDLMQMIIRGLPVGAVLTLDVGDHVPFVSRPLETAPQSGEKTNELLLDGQQRLTAIWRTLHNTYPERTYFIELPDGGSNASGQVVSVSRWSRNGTLYPIWVDDPAQCWWRRYVPLHLLRPDPEGETKAKEWVQQVAGADLQLTLDLMLGINALRVKIASYNLPFLSLDVGTPRDVVLDVFVKMNTRSVSLTAFDIIVAQTEEATGQSLHALVNGLAASVPGLPAYDAAEDVALNVMALLQDRVPNQTGYLGMDFQRMVTDWPLLVEGARIAIEFLEQEFVFDSSRLPTESVLAPLIALWAAVPHQPDKRGNARILLRKYLWRAFFTDRYERAAATAALQDYRGLRDVLAGKADQSSVPCFNEIQHPLPTVEALVQAGWPKKRDRLARAILLLSLRGGALDLADGQVVTRQNLGQREYHHLFPVAYLRDRGVEENDAYRAMNCALVSWRTNRAISAKEPIKYLIERSEASDLGVPEIRHRLHTHGIDIDALSQDDYDAFLRQRSETATLAIKTLCNGEAWKPSVT